MEISWLKFKKINSEVNIIKDTDEKDTGRNRIYIWNGLEAKKKDVIKNRLNKIYSRAGRSRN